MIPKRCRVFENITFVRFVNKKKLEENRRNQIFYKNPSEK